MSEEKRREERRGGKEDRAPRVAVCCVGSVLRAITRGRNRRLSNLEENAAHLSPAQRARELQRAHAQLLRKILVGGEGESELAGRGAESDTSF